MKTLTAFTLFIGLGVILSCNQQTQEQKPRVIEKKEEAIKPESPLPHGGQIQPLSVQKKDTLCAWVFVLRIDAERPKGAKSIYLTRKGGAVWSTHDLRSDHYVRLDFADNAPLKFPKGTPIYVDCSNGELMNPSVYFKILFTPDRGKIHPKYLNRDEYERRLGSWFVLMREAHDSVSAN